MKRVLYWLILPLLLCMLSGCSFQGQADIAATTLPVYEFTARLCEGTGITVTRLVTESVSCLHDYTLQVSQMRAISGAKAVVISGAGLEEFLEDALSGVDTVIDASQGLALLEGGHSHGDEHEHDHDDGHGHVHAEDPHIWLSPENAKAMAENIYHGLSALYPEHAPRLQANLEALTAELDALESYGRQQLAELSCRELITFHDGFSYLAESFGLTILEAIEEESGSEASAAQLIDLIGLVREHELCALFTETNGADAAASIIAAETGARLYALDMAMAGDSYFTAMYHNIDTLKEALQ